MKVSLWKHANGMFLNEDFTMVAKPSFNTTSPQRTLILKERFKTGINKIELLSTITDDELQKFVDESVIHWKPIVPYLKMDSKKILEQL